MAKHTVGNTCAVGSDMTCMRKVMDALGTFLLRNKRGFMPVQDCAQHCRQINGKQKC